MSPSAPRCPRPCGPSRPAATDPGKTVTLTQPVSRRSTTQLLVYRGYGGVRGSPAATTDSGTATHVAPAQPVLGGDYVVDFFADRSASTTSWTPAAADTARGSVVGTSTTRYSTFVSDPGAPTSAGTYPGTRRRGERSLHQGSRHDRGPASLTTGGPPRPHTKGRGGPPLTASPRCRREEVTVGDRPVRPIPVPFSRNLFRQQVAKPGFTPGLGATAPGPAVRQVSPSGLPTAQGAPTVVGQDSVVSITR